MAMRRRTLLRAMWGATASMVCGVAGTTRVSAQQSSTGQASPVATPREPDLQRFSEAALQVLFFARRAVSNVGGHSVTCPHLLIGVTHVEPHLLNAVLAAGWDAVRLRTRIASLLESSPRLPEDVDVPLSSGVLRALQRATISLDPDEQVAPVHLFVSVLAEREELEAISPVLREAGVRMPAPR